MTAMEREEMAVKMKALDKEERKIALRMFPTSALFEELQRRSVMQEEMIKNVKVALNGGVFDA